MVPTDLTFAGNHELSNWNLAVWIQPEAACDYTVYPPPLGVYAYLFEQADLTFLSDRPYTLPHLGSTAANYTLCLRQGSIWYHHTHVTAEVIYETVSCFCLKPNLFPHTSHYTPGGESHAANI